MRSTTEMEIIIDKYADTVKRICFLYVKKYHDVEDIFQEVFIKLMNYDKEFENDEHLKSWIIRVSINKCKDHLKSFFIKKTCSLENLDYDIPKLEKEDSYVLEAVLALPEKYKAPIYLHYFEGYTANEIGGILHKNENTIYTLLSRGRAKLKEVLGDEE
ncbi:MAG: RNA polymerase sigma factor [Oscillospiraceae bacterium]